MSRSRTIAGVLALSMVAGAACAGPFDMPKPEVFRRPEDQTRARLIDKPCVSADVGHGCYRFDGRLIRDTPCAYHIDSGTIGFLPTDQCFKMQGPERYRGIWIDAFEGQDFIPEGTSLPDWPRTDPTTPSWREQADRVQAARIWLNVDRAGVAHDVNANGRKMRIEFIGRKTMYQGAYGHMGMSGNEIIVDRVISLEPAP